MSAKSGNWKLCLMFLTWIYATEGTYQDPNIILSSYQSGGWEVAQPIVHVQDEWGRWYWEVIFKRQVRGKKSVGKKDEK